MPLPLALLLLLLPVVVYCSVRAVAPGLGGAPEGRPSEHRRDTDVWHVLMGLAMIAMLLGALARPLAFAALVVSAVGLCWGVLSADRRTSGAAQVRLMIGAGAMAVMTLPLAAPAMAADGSQEMAGMSGMSGIGPAPVPLVLALLAGLLAVAVLRLPSVVRRAPDGAAVRRLDAGCDVVMAGAMAAMLVTLL